MATAEFDIALDVKQAITSLQRLEKEMKDFGKKSEDGLKSFSGFARSAFSSLADSSGRANRSLDTIAGGLRTFGAIAVGALGVIAINKLADGFGSVVTAAIEKEKALQGVQFALQRTGQYSGDAFRQVSDFADKLEATKGIADDTALEMFTLASSFGLSKDEAMKAVDAATELSAATGKDLKDSVNTVSKSFNGVVGELGKLNPAMKNLTQAELEAGAAADLLLKTLGGTAGSQLQTFDGQVKGVANSFDDLKVSIGTLITQNPAIIGLVRGVGEAIRTIDDFVNNNRSGLTKTIGQIAVGFGKQIPPLLLSLDAMNRGFQMITSGVTIKDFFDKTALAVGFLTDQILGLQLALLQLKKTFSDTNIARAALDANGQAQAIADLQKIPGFDIEKIKAQAPEILVKLEHEGLIKKDDLTPMIAELQKQRDDLATRMGVLTQGVAVPEGQKPESDSLLQKLADGLAKSLIESEALIGSNASKPTPQNLPQGGSDPGFPMPEADSTGGLTFNIADAIAGVIGDTFLTIGESFGAGLLKGGSDGARQFVGQAAGAVAMAFGADGQTAQGIAKAVEFLGQDPDTFKGAVDGFVEGIPVVIDNIVENIPYLMEVLAANSGEIITALVSASPRIAVALAKSMPMVAEELAKEFSEGFGYQNQKLIGAGDQFAESTKGAGAAIESYFRIDFPEDMREGGIALMQSLEDGLEGLVFGIGESLTNGSDAIKSAGEDFKAAMPAARDAIKEGAVSARNSIAAGGAAFDGTIRESGSSVAAEWHRAADGIGGAWERLSTYIGTIVPQKIDASLAVVAEGWDTITQGASTEIWNKSIAAWSNIQDASLIFWTNINKAGESFFDWVEGLFGGGDGGVSGAWDGFKKGGTDGDPSTPHMLGGTVPQGFPDDSYRARLTSGELIVPMDDVNRLRSFLDRSEASGSGGMPVDLEVVAMLARIASLLERDQTVRSEVRVNENAIAEVTLQLQRQGQRMRA